MKHWFLCLGLMAATFPARAAEVEWLTNITNALEQAKADNKFIFINFTGSDWSVWSQRSKREVFDTPEFARFAATNFVLVEADFPRDKPLSAEQKQANVALGETYKVDHLPTFILLNSEGKHVAAGGYVEGGVRSFIAMMIQIPGIRPVDLSDIPPSPVPDPPEPAKPPSEPFMPIAPTPAIQYGDLTLKAISGPANKRLALINNESLLVGESAKIKVHDSRVVVVCKEIRDDSVLVTVDGKLTELKLAHKK
jgi:thioredoxin-related protein